MKMAPLFNLFLIIQINYYSMFKKNQTNENKAPTTQVKKANKVESK